MPVSDCLLIKQAFGNCELTGCFNSKSRFVSTILSPLFSALFHGDENGERTLFVWTI